MMDTDGLYYNHLYRLGFVNQNQKLLNKLKLKVFEDIYIYTFIAAKQPYMNVCVTIV